MRAPPPGQKYEDKLIVPHHLKLSTAQYERVSAFAAAQGMSMAEVFRRGAMRLIEETQK